MDIGVTMVTVRDDEHHRTFPCLLIITMATAEQYLMLDNSPDLEISSAHGISKRPYHKSL